MIGARESGGHSTHFLRGIGVVSLSDETPRYCPFGCHFCDSLNRKSSHLSYNWSRNFFLV